MTTRSLLAALLAISVSACSGASAQECADEPTDDCRTPGDAKAVVAFWLGAGHERWFAKDPEFDRRFGERFATLYEKAAEGEIDDWAATADGALALVILLDQYPRNAFRGTARMYTTERAAKKIADDAVAAGHDAAVAQELRLFFVLPFAHSEDLRDQDRAVRLSRELGETDLYHAERHRDVIRRFGRFPHRNAALGRATTPEEQIYLEQDGYPG
jgi:uncharacterized protein (DUF924 family)